MSFDDSEVTEDCVPDLIDGIIASEYMDEACRLLLTGIARLYGLEMLRWADEARHSLLYVDKAWMCGVGRAIVSNQVCQVYLMQVVLLWS